jgi:hypothetical protein
MKFRKKFFKLWLDQLCKVCVKTRDDFTCQIQQCQGGKDPITGKFRPGCAGKMTFRDYNCQWCHVKSRSSNNLRWDLLNSICGCGHCHHWAHANPNEFGIWLANKFPARNDYINDRAKEPRKTWREEDFREIERMLLQKCIDLEVSLECFSKKPRKRFIKRLEEFKKGGK